MVYCSAVAGGEGLKKSAQQQSSPENRSCGAQVSLHGASSPLPLPHEEELHKAISLQGCLWAEIISSLNRKGSYKVGGCREGSQNMKNWYSPLSNYAAALPGAGTKVCRHIFCLLAEVGSRHSHFSPGGHGQVHTGSCGLPFLFWMVWVRIKHRDIIKGFCHAGHVYTSTVGMEKLLASSVSGLKFIHIPPTTPAFLGSQGDGLRIMLYGTFLRCYQP